MCSWIQAFGAVARGWVITLLCSTAYVSEARSLPVDPKKIPTPSPAPREGDDPPPIDHAQYTTESGFLIPKLATYEKYDPSFTPSRQNGANTYFNVLQTLSSLEDKPIPAVLQRTPNGVAFSFGPIAEDIVARLVSVDRSNAIVKMIKPLFKKYDKPKATIALYIISENPQYIKQSDKEQVEYIDRWISNEFEIFNESNTPLITSNTKVYVSLLAIDIIRKRKMLTGSDLDVNCYAKEIGLLPNYTCKT